MSEPTQSAVGLARDGEGAGSPIGAPPVVAYLRVLAQKDLEEQDWPIAEGQNEHVPLVHRRILLSTHTEPCTQACH